MTATYRADIDIEQICIDGGTQPRAEINTTLVSEYAEAMELGVDFPPVDVFQDGKTYWLAEYADEVDAKLEGK